MASTNQTSVRYFFRYRAPTRISFSGWNGHQREKPNGVSFDYLADRAKVVVFDERLPTKPRLHYGIGFDLIVEQSDRERAQLVARAIVLDLIAVIAFCEACYVGGPEFVSRYRVPESGIRLQDAAFFVLDKDYPPIETSLRIVNLSRLKDIFSKINGVPDGRRRQTIKRSLHWFWKSMENSDIRDRFLHLWVAVEHLERELKSVYSIAPSKTGYPRCTQCKKEFRLCPDCNSDFGYIAASGFAGLRKLVIDCGLRSGLFDRLHSVRSKLVHAGIAKEQEIRRALDDTRTLLSKAVFTLADIEPSRTDALPKSVRLESKPMVLSFEGTVQVEGPLVLNDVHLQPMVYGRYAHKFEIDEGSDELINLTDVEHEFQGAFVTGNMEKKALVDSSTNVVDFWERED